MKLEIVFKILLISPWYCKVDGLTPTYQISHRQSQLAQRMTPIRRLSTFNDSEQNQSRIAYDNIAASVVKNDLKGTNMELVVRGQKFSSFRRRFDYLSLRSNSNSQSTWKRDNSQNENVAQLLIACGLSDKESQEGNNVDVLQIYSSIVSEDDIKFDINTAFGVDLSRVVIEKISDKSKGSAIEVHNRWTKDDVYRMEAFFEGCDEPFFRVDKKLDFCEDPGPVGAGDTLVMNVKSSLLLDNMEPLHSKEVYVRTYDFVDGEVLSTKTQRVPGCVANVDLRTVLIPKETQSGKDDDIVDYEVLIDGMADAVLSRGLLSVLQKVLSSIDARNVLNIDPFTVADEIRLRNVLSAGRNDGLANMVSIVQQQIKEQLLDFSDGANDSTDRIDADSIQRKKKPTVAMLLSGGVDSSVALNLLVRQGYDVTAFYLKIWLEDELAHLGQCPWEDDYHVCTQVCEQAGVPLESISLQREYKEKVISYTISEAKKGRTPNPDIMCNSRVKFGCFYDEISTRNFDFVATGHYAQLEDKETLEGMKKILLRAPDPVKDQSYFLAALNQQQLNRVLFPIGQYPKGKVRELAKEFDLPNMNRPDSQGLCFLGKVRFEDFLGSYLGTEPGDIIDADTRDVIGRHKGIWFHTVGQRKGIGKVLDPKATAKGPWYVVAKDTSKRLIIASNRYDEKQFESTRKEFFVEDVQWITDIPPESSSVGTHVTMKIRHGPKIVQGLLQLEEGQNMGMVILDEKDGGLAPGQFVVFYDGTECLGSGVISERHWLRFLELDKVTTENVKEESY